MPLMVYVRYDSLKEEKATNQPNPPVRSEKIPQRVEKQDHEATTKSNIGVGALSTLGQDILPEKYV